jgi:hypothetical protein
MFVITCAFPGCDARFMPGFSDAGGDPDSWLELADDRVVCPEHRERAANHLKKSDLHPDQREHGFGAPEDGSGERYAMRRETRPWLAHTAWWLVHNCIAHPLIGVLPRRPAFRFHDWTSRKMHGERSVRR